MLLWLSNSSTLNSTFLILFFLYVVLKATMSGFATIEFLYTVDTINRLVTVKAYNYNWTEASLVRQVILKNLQ